VFQDERQGYLTRVSSAIISGSGGVSQYRDDLKLLADFAAPLAVSSLDPMAQGHTVLPPYGSGPGRERDVVPPKIAALAHCSGPRRLQRVCRHCRLKATTSAVK